MRDPLHITVPGFQGTLDELIQFVRSGQVRLTSLPLAAITAQLLERVQAIEGKDKLESGEAVEIAATLIRIKSFSILPQEPASLQGLTVFDSKPAGHALIQDLESLRLSIERLREMWAHALPAGSARFDTPPELETAPAEAPPSLLDLIRQLEVALHLTRNAPPPLSYRQETYPLEQLSSWILQRSTEAKRAGKQLILNEFLSELPEIAPGLFLAALELARGGSVALGQPGALDDITVSMLEPSSA
jgi:segregation and condensation protein A